MFGVPVSPITLLFIHTQGHRNTQAILPLLVVEVVCVCNHHVSFRKSSSRNSLSSHRKYMQTLNTKNKLMIKHNIHTVCAACVHRFTTVPLCSKVEKIKYNIGLLKFHLRANEQLYFIWALFVYMLIIGTTSTTPHEINPAWASSLVATLPPSVRFVRCKTFGEEG